VLFLNLQKCYYIIRLLFVAVTIQVADALRTILGMIRMALLEEPILFCKFSIDNPLTADAKTLLLITGRISAKTIST
jgi:hypothetical protein